MLNWLTDLFRSDNTISLRELDIERRKTALAVKANNERLRRLALQEERDAYAAIFTDYPAPSEEEDLQKALANRFYCRQVNNGKNPLDGGY